MKTLSGLPAIVAGGLTAIATVQGFTPPPSGQSAIDHAATLTQRNALAAEHDIGGSSDYAFTGFSDTTGWNTTTVTTADGLISALSGAGTTESLLITCNFNGSTNTTETANSVAVGSLSANGAIDYGYDRPGQNIRVVAGSGYSPVIGGNVYLNGFDQIEFDGIQFDKLLYFQTSGTYPTLACAALNNCTIGDEVRFFYARSGHIENCVFKPSATASLGARVKSWAEYMRVWNCQFHRMNVAIDPLINFSFTESYQSNWVVKRWVAGCTLYNYDYTTNAGSGNHSDFFQYSTSTDIHDGYHLLIEFNIIVANGVDSQNIFGDDSSATSVLNNEVLIHNCILISNAPANAVLWDQGNDGDLRAYRLLTGRGNKLDPTGTVDAQVQIWVLDTGSGTGTYEVRECFGIVNDGATNTITQADNVTVNTKANASAGTKMEDVYTMSGANFTTDAYSRIIYDMPDDGVTDYATARAAIIAFYEPIAGWNDGTGCGPIDPAEWPTTFGGALS